MSLKLENLNIEGTLALPSPAQLRDALALTAQASQTVGRARETLADILEGRDARLFAVVGPCSVHDIDEALEYAHRLRALAAELEDVLFVVMRVYFEKPRTTTGWKGLINDPDLDDSFDVARGLAIARKLLLDVNALGLPVGTEALDPISPQYLGELVAWSAIGARTTESQTHREMASGLSTPVGFKNGTDGSLAVAVNAMLSAASPHTFLGVDANGRVAQVRTRGNPLGHVILRGGARPNHDEASVRAACAALDAAGLPARLVVDCSHGNSAKDPARQPEVLQEVVRQRIAGQRALRGVMLESNLEPGSQRIVCGRHGLRRGVSVTDACLGWSDTEATLRDAARRLRAARV